MLMYSAIALLALPAPILAGIMSPIVVINLSQNDVIVDMTLGQSCVYTSFDNDQLEWYYKAWQSVDLATDWVSIGGAGGGLTASDVVGFRQLDNYLQMYKRRFGIDNLRRGRSPSVDITPLRRLDPEDARGVPFSVHEIEMKGSGDCIGRNSWKEFALIMNGTRTVYRLLDPGTGNWRVSEERFISTRTAEPGRDEIDIGPGGTFSVWKVIWNLAVATLQTLALLTEVGIAADLDTLTYVRRPGGRVTYLRLEGQTIIKASRSLQYFTRPQTLQLAATTNGEFYFQGFDPVVVAGVPNVNPSGVVDEIPILAFSDLYNSVPLDKRNACLSKKKAFGDGLSCRTAGTSFIIQATGDVVAIPLPGVDSFPEALARVYRNAHDEL